MASINSLPEGKYKIDPNSKTAEILDIIKSEFSNYDNGKRTWVNDKVKEEYEYLEKALKNVDDDASRKYIISKRLGMVPEFSHNNLPMLDEYRDLKWQEEFKAPTWDNIDKLEPGFFDPKSPNYFGKMPKETLAMYQKKMGIDDADSFWNRASEEEVKRTRHKIAHGEDEGGWFESPTAFAHNLGGSLMTLLNRRSQEAIERGEDPTLKDIALDAVENAAYTYNPAGKLVAPLKIGAGEGTKFLLGGLANAANPSIMETLDAAAYGDDENTDRKNFSLADVLLGTGVNAAMGGIGERIPGVKNLFKEVAPQKVMVAGKEVTVAPNVAKKLEQNGLGQINKRYERFDKMAPPKSSRLAMKNKKAEEGLDVDGVKALREQEWQKFKKEFPDAAKNLEKRDEFWRGAYKAGKKKAQENADALLGRQNTIVNQLNLGGAGEVGPGVGSFVSNKTGDALSENPTARNYLVKRALRETGVPARLLYPLLDYKTDLTEKEKLEQLLGR